MKRVKPPSVTERQALAALWREYPELAATPPAELSASELRRLVALGQERTR